MYLNEAAKTRTVGLLGHPVQHSYSPIMQNAAFEYLNLDYIYLPFDVDPENLGTAVKGIKALGFIGVNVTVPYKNDVIKYLDWVSEDADSIGSVNTIHNCNGCLNGYTTDGEGFMKSLIDEWQNPSGCNAVIAGAGGSARATAYALLKSGANVRIINRTKERAVNLARSLKKLDSKWSLEVVDYDYDDMQKAIGMADLLVNCTSAGMYPNVNSSPFPLELLHKEMFVYDQVYNPFETKLLNKAKEVCIGASNGLMMLVYQGAASFKIWTGKEAPAQIMRSEIMKTITDN